MNDVQGTQSPSRTRNRIKGISVVSRYGVYRCSAAQWLWNAFDFLLQKQVHVKQVDIVEPLRGFEERLARSLRLRTVATGADELFTQPTSKICTSF